jgi:hypothetical protein
MSGDVTVEAIGKQVARERAQLLEHGDRIAADACGKLEIAMPPSGVAAVAPAIATLMRIRAGEWPALREFYLSEMRPLIVGQPGGVQLDDPERARLRFETLRTLLPVSLHVALAELERIYDRHRELMRYVRLSTLLEAWLLVHVPLAFTLIALAMVHMIAVFRY